MYPSHSGILEGQPAVRLRIKQRAWMNFLALHRDWSPGFQLVRGAIERKVVRAQIDLCHVR